MTYPLTLRQQAIELRLQGKTLKEISTELDVNHQTVSDWCRDQSAEGSRVRQQRIFEATQDLVVEAVNHVAEKLPTMSDRNLIASLSASSNANLSAIRLMQDERRHSNELLESLRQQLLARPLHERVALLEDAEQSTTLPEEDAATEELDPGTLLMPLSYHKRPLCPR